MDLFKDGITTSSYSAPRNDIPLTEIEKAYGSVEAWIAKNIRYISTFYNQRYNYNNSFFGQARPTDYNTMRFTPGVAPVTRMQENYRYYLGEQFNYKYSFLESAPDGSTIPAPFIPGQRVFQVIEFLKGSYASVVRNAKVRCQSSSRDSQTYRERMVALALLRYDNLESFNEMAKQGVDIQTPFDGLEVKDKKDLLRKAQETPIERAEILGNEIISRVIHKYNILSKAIRSWTDTRIAGPSGMLFRRYGTRVDVQVIPPTHLIVDNRVDDEFNRDARFRGFVEFLTPEEIMERGYSGIGREERDALFEMVATEAVGSASLLGTTINFMWSKPQTREIACVTGYFIYLNDTRLVYRRDKNGNIKIPYSYKKLKDSDTRSGEIMKPILYHGTLIADRFLVDYGPADETMYDPLDPDRPLFPLHVILPGVTNGIVKSAVDRIRDHQDMHDAISLRIRQRLARAHGKIPVIDGARFDSTKTPKSFMQDIVTLGFTVANGSNGEEFDPTMNRRGNMAEYLDFTFDSDVQQLLNLKNEEERLINEMFNTSPVVMGTNKTYVGYNTQQQSINQATLSLANDYENHMQFVTNFLQHLLNYLKNYFLTEQGQREAELFLSPRSLHLLKVTENLPFENLSTFVDMRDNMSDIERQQIVGIAQTVLPTGNIEALMALVKIQNASTKTDVINELEYFAERKLKEQQQQQQQQAMMQAAALAQQGDNMNQQQQLKNEGAVQAKQAEAEGRIANTLVQQGIQE
jgi:hypothetical protein